MSKWLEGKVVSKKQWTETLFSLQIDAPIPPFEAGQFTRVGLEIDGELVPRSYSFVNAPEEKPLEIYFIIVPGGPLTPRLAALEAGDSITVANRGTGLLTLSQIPDSKYLWMLSTGTALGPFLSILKAGVAKQRYEKIVLVHAVRTAEELTYRDQVDAQLAEYGEQLVYIPFVSREASDFALGGRVPAAIEDGRLEEKAGIKLEAETSHVMICGNPDMVSDTKDVLEKRGMQRHKRKEPGHYSQENYW